MLVAASQHYREPLNLVGLQMHVGYLKDFEFNDVVVAMTNYRKDLNNTTMFDPNQIRELLIGAY